MTQSTRPQYSQLTTRLAAARRAYKRVAALSGLVVFLIEGIGTLSLLILSQIAFALGPAGRIGLFILAAVALVFFAIRHIVRPLLREITDRQLALFLEARSPEFEGSLVAAVEFGADQSITGRQGQIVESILDQAVARATRFDLRRAIDLARLRKYGALAAVLIAVYAIAAITMPQTIGRRVARAFTPWKPTPDEIVVVPPPPAVLAPIDLTVSPGDIAVVRGGALQLQAQLNRAPRDAVAFHFRPTAAASHDTSWKLQPMTEAQQLNAYALSLPDINEDLEYFVSAENAKSEPHHVTVFDPLLIKSYEITTKYPAYLKLPDRVEQADAPDVSAVQGSTVSIRILTNGTLKSGQIQWDGRPATDATLDPKEAGVAVATFEVKDNASFHVQVADLHGQTVQTPTPASAVAIADAPPEVKLLAPTGGNVDTNPLGEIAFSAELTDDLALDSADLVLSRGLDPATVPIRTPLVLDPKPVDGTGLTTAHANTTLMLEELKPPLTPGELLSAYVEVKDRKGQKMSSDLVQIMIGPFESWAAYQAEEKAHPHVSFHLEPILAAAWSLNRTAGQMSPNDLSRELDELAGQMVDANGALHPYFTPEHTPPDKVHFGEEAMAHAKTAHESLKKHDVAQAVLLLRAAIAELNEAGYSDTVAIHPPPPPADNAAMTSSETQETIKKMNALMEEQKPKGGADGKNAKAEKDKAAETADQVAKTEQIEKEHADLLDKLKKADAAGAQAAPKAQANAAKNASDKHDKLADKTAAAAKAIKDAAGTDANKKGAADAMANAAAAMKDAAAQLKDGKLKDAIAKAETAQKQIAAAKTALQGSSQDAVNATLDKAEGLATAAARKQQDLIDKTESLGKAGAGEKKEKAAPLGEAQVKLNQDIKALADAIDGLAKVGDAGGLKPETAKLVTQAKQQLARGRVEQHIANAAIQLAGADAAGAAAEQKKVKDALDTVGQSLKDASGTRAGDLASALKHAKGEAAQVAANLAELKAGAGNKPGEDAKGKDAKGEDAKKAGQKPGEDAKAGHKPGEDAKAGGKDGAGAQTGADRKELAAKTADAIARLANQLKARDFANGNKAFAQDAKQIASDAEAPNKLTDELVNEPAKIGDLANMTQRVADHLEAEYESTLKSQQLFAAQREECPPQYRPLVNQYFESISNTK